MNIFCITRLMETVYEYVIYIGTFKHIFLCVGSLRKVPWNLVQNTFRLLPILLSMCPIVLFQIFPSSTVVLLSFYIVSREFHISLRNLIEL